MSRAVARRRLLEICDQERPALIESWVRHILDVPAFAHRPVDEIHDNVEHCLEAFRARLETGSEAPLEAFVDRLAHQRFDTGFSIAGPLLAASHFRTAVTEIVGAESSEPEVLLAADDLIDGFARRFAESFAARSIAASEQGYRDLFEYAGDILLSLNASGALTHANRRFEDLVGGPREPWIGRPLDALVSSDDRVAARTYLDAVLAGNVPTEPVRLRCVTNDGAVRVAVLNARAWRTGERLAVVAILRDVTEEEAVRARVIEAEKLSSVGQIAASVGHELNNPLTWLLASLDQLERRIGAPASLDDPAARGRLREQITDALVAARRMEEIVGDLRVYSRAREEKSEVFVPTDAIELALRMTGPELRCRAAVERVYGELPVMHGRLGRLSQVFANLFVNAAHALSDRSPEDSVVRVAAKYRDGWVIVSVADNGPGMTPEIAARAFEPFYTTKSASGGTGLGLWVSRTIVEEHGGTIEVQSRPGAGAVFTVRLPVRTPAVDDPALADQREQGAEQPGSTQSSERRPVLLLLDDEPILLRYLVWEFEQDYDVITAPSGRAAIEALQSRGGAVDAMLCDLMMPDMTGMEFHRWLQQHWPHLIPRLAFMSGGVCTDRERDFLAQTPHRMIEKPASVEEIRRVVDSLAAGTTVRD